jgi:hypothetical protein
MALAIAAPVIRAFIPPYFLAFTLISPVIIVLGHSLALPGGFPGLLADLGPAITLAPDPDIPDKQTPAVTTPNLRGHGFPFLGKS